MPKIYIGTSGWSYKVVKDSFFPKSVPPAQHLSYLAQHFNSVEINGSFYRLQPATHYEKWYQSTPKDFIFAVKVSRFVTHIKKMKDVGDEWKSFLETTVPLKEKRGPFLLQFPASFKGTEEDRARLDHFFSETVQDASLRFAAEFRHVDCHQPKMIEVLKHHRVALVLGQSALYPLAPLTDTSNFVYLRFHGPKELFASGYSHDELGAWADLVVKSMQNGKDVYAYFNNAMPTLAPANAKTLEELIALRVAKTPTKDGWNDVLP